MKNRYIDTRTHGQAQASPALMHDWSILGGILRFPSKFLFETIELVLKMHEELNANRKCWEHADRLI